MITDFPPPLSVQQIYSSQKRYNRVNIPANISMTTGTSIWSFGQGLQIVAITDKIYIHVASGIYAVTGGSASLYLYRSTVGIPAQGSAPYASDVQLAQIASGASTTSAALTNYYYFDTGLTPNTTYYYYLAGSNNTAGDGVQSYVNTNSVYFFYETNASANRSVLEVLCV
jgi:hypothetical protein